MENGRPEAAHRGMLIRRYRAVHDEDPSPTRPGSEQPAL